MFKKALFCWGLVLITGCGEGIIAPVDSPAAPSASDSVASETDTGTGSISGAAQLSSLGDHSGITVSAGGIETLTDADGAYSLQNVPEGSYTVSFRYNAGCETTGSVTGQARFSDGLNRSGTTVVLQYAPNCFVSHEFFAVAVFENENTEMDDVTLEMGTIARRKTITQADGTFNFDNVPVGNYAGALPLQPNPGIGQYEQPVGSYALAIATSGLDEDNGPNSAYLMRAFPSPDFRNDPYFQDTRPLLISDAIETDVGEVILYPVTTITTTELYFPDYPRAGFDFSTASVVASDSSEADIQLSYGADFTNIIGVEGQIRDGGDTDMQSFLEAYTDGFSPSVSIEDSVVRFAYPQEFNHVISVETKEGHYGKFKLLPSCTGGGDHGPFRCFDLLYYYQGDGSSTFQY